MTKTTKKTTKKTTARKTTPVVKPFPAPGPGEITARVGDTRLNIKADLVADFFALHPPIPPATGKVTVLTHIPTGMSVGRYRTRGLAHWLACELRKLGGAELWQFTDPDHLAKSGANGLLTRIRAMVDPFTAEQTMKAAAPIKAALAAIEKGKGMVLNHRTGKTEPAHADQAAAMKYSAPWRGGVDWVAAGKKAYETRLRNLAARQALQATQAPQAPRPQALPGPQAPQAQAQAPKAPKAPKAQAPKAQAPKAPKAQALQAPRPQAPKAQAATRARA